MLVVAVCCCLVLCGCGWRCLFLFDVIRCCVSLFVVAVVVVVVVVVLFCVLLFVVV